MTKRFGSLTAVDNLTLRVDPGEAVLGFVVQGLAEQVDVLKTVRAVTPWHWLIDGNPLGNGSALEAGLLPVVTSVVLAAAGTALFVRRDLH